ncbi:MAG: hypothetical protein L6Q76_08810 [Polyangiaceae bacterium]|nr:hypothetical protein [Polyangiaceae bacterium]
MAEDPTGGADQTRPTATSVGAIRPYVGDSKSPAALTLLGHLAASVAELVAEGDLEAARVAHDAIGRLLRVKEEVPREPPSFAPVVQIRKVKGE